MAGEIAVFAKKVRPIVRHDQRQPNNPAAQTIQMPVAHANDACALAQLKNLFHRTPDR